MSENTFLVNLERLHKVYSFINCKILQEERKVHELCQTYPLGDRDMFFGDYDKLTAIYRNLKDCIDLMDKYLNSK